MYVPRAVSHRETLHTKRPRDERSYAPWDSTCHQNDDEGPMPRYVAPIYVEGPHPLEGMRFLSPWVLLQAVTSSKSRSARTTSEGSEGNVSTTD